MDGKKPGAKALAELNERIDTLAAEWNAPGAVAVHWNGKQVHCGVYGTADRKSERPFERESGIAVAYENRFLLGLCIGRLLDESKLALRDALSLYVPEYVYAERITLRQLCLKQSGVPDFWAEKAMREMQQAPEYAGLDEGERLRADVGLTLRKFEFDKVISWLNGQELSCRPGEMPTDDLENRSETLLLRRVVERAAGMPLPELVRKEILRPLGMEPCGEGQETTAYLYTRSGEWLHWADTPGAEDAFWLDLGGAQKLLAAVAERKLLSKKAWKAISMPGAWGQSAAFDDLSGMLCARDFGYGETGWKCWLYADWETGLGLIYLTNSQPEIRPMPEGRRTFVRLLRETVGAAFVYPNKTRLVPFGPGNVWGAMRLETEPEQREFMCPAAEAICIGAACRQKLFVLTEGRRAVGLLGMSVDRKKEKYYIESVIIDRRYQRRGFGSVMLRLGLEYLKKQGCRSIRIGVNRYNTAARRLYTSVGFCDRSVHEDFVQMEATL